MRVNTKTLTIISLFTAVSIVLSLSPLKFSAPFAPFLKYQVWEIAIVTAFLLFGLKVGVSISLINTLVLFAFFPGDLPTGPIYNLIALLSIILGMFIIQKSLSKKFNYKKQVILITLSTIAGMILRVTIMSIVNWIVLPYPYPIGYSIPIEGIPAILSVTALFNATIVLYTIPLGYLIARAVGVTTKS